MTTLFFFVLYFPQVPQAQLPDGGGRARAEGAAAAATRGRRLQEEERRIAQPLGERRNAAGAALVANARERLRRERERRRGGRCLGRATRGGLVDAGGVARNERFARTGRGARRDARPDSRPAVIRGRGRGDSEMVRRSIYDVERPARERHGCAAPRTAAVANGRGGGERARVAARLPDRPGPLEPLDAHRRDSERAAFRGRVARSRPLDDARSCDSECAAFCRRTTRPRQLDARSRDSERTAFRGRTAGARLLDDARFCNGASEVGAWTTKQTSRHNQHRLRSAKYMSCVASHCVSISSWGVGLSALRIFGGRAIDRRRALLRRVRRRMTRRRLAVAERRARRRRAWRRLTQLPAAMPAPPTTPAAQPQMEVRRRRQPTPRRPRNHRRRTPSRRGSAFMGSQRSKVTVRRAGRRSSSTATSSSTLGCIRPQTRPRVRTTPRPDRSDGEPAPPPALAPAPSPPRPRPRAYLPSRTCSRLSRACSPLLCFLVLIAACCSLHNAIASDHSACSVRQVI